MSGRHYLIPASTTRCEIRVINSRFIATAGQAFNVEAAREFVNRVRTEYHDATHHVPAYLIGSGNSVIAHCSDDGEPAGTAGRPVLAVLQGSGLGDIVVVVTRYFGGTKLGTGGLVRAYTDATKSVLEILPHARKMATHVVILEFGYSYFERLRLLVTAQHGLILDEDFGVGVTLTARFPVDHYEAFQSALSELTAGQVKAVIIETDPDTVVAL